MNNSNSDLPLPDTRKWQPKKSSSETLKSAFFKRCLAIETFIRLRSQLEREMNINNFDSGFGIEDIIREEFSQLLPNRYSVKAGVINDRYGNTAGDFEVVIFNEQWFPLVKAGATAASRRIHLPIDGVYAVCEVKQTLDFKTLDKAMEKLVICHRLHRPHTYANRLVENRENSQCIHGLSNPLYSMIIATDLKEGIELDRLVERFFDINKTLERLEVIHGLCVLGHGTVTWGFRDNDGELRQALFMMEDLYLPIFPIYYKVPTIGSAFYPLMADLLSHLYHSVLAPEDVAAVYGNPIPPISIPNSPDIVLKPDAQWLSILNQVCSTKHESMPHLNLDNIPIKTRKTRKPRKPRGFGLNR